MNTIKLIIADQNKKTIDSPIWFGRVWAVIHQALVQFGAFSIGKYGQKAPLTDSLESAAFTAHEFHGIFKFSKMWTSVVGFETRENRCMTIMQSVNAGYDFLSENESYVYLMMDADEGEVAKNTLLNIGRDLIKNGYNVFLSEQENMNGIYIPLTEQLILNSIKDKALT